VKIVLRALEVVYFNPNRAAELLLSGDLPNHPAFAFAKLNGPEPDPEVIPTDNLKQLWADTKIDIPMLVQSSEACGRDSFQPSNCLQS
jgi:hypothetical protein